MPLEEGFELSETRGPYKLTLSSRKRNGPGARPSSSNGLSERVIKCIIKCTTTGYLLSWAYSSMVMKLMWGDS